MNKGENISEKRLLIVLDEIEDMYLRQRTAKECEIAREYSVMLKEILKIGEGWLDKPITTEQ